MRVLVVYESVLGNTRVIAEAVASGIRSTAPHAAVRCLPASRVLAEPVEADLVVVGGPTHFFGLPAERTRRIWVEGVLRRGRAEGATASLEPGAAGPGLREWFEELAARPPGPPAAALAAAFDTRLGRTVSRGAARRIGQLLRRHGYRLIARPRGFVVEDLTGPLRPGERDRAEAWGAQVAAVASWWLQEDGDARWSSGRPA